MESHRASLSQYSEYLLSSLIIGIFWLTIRIAKYRIPYRMDWLSVWCIDSAKIYLIRVRRSLYLLLGRGFSVWSWEHMQHRKYSLRLIDYNISPRISIEVYCVEFMRYISLKSSIYLCFWSFCLPCCNFSFIDEKIFRGLSNCDRPN
jgi:hypothetical protein